VSSPRLDSEQEQQLEKTRSVISDAIRNAAGAIPFDRFMELALYAPGAGYYVNGAHKFGEQGDFVTAPEISPLFSRCLGNQCAAILGETGGNILEFGAGAGVMAADLLMQLDCLAQLPGRYQILELSAELRARQRETLAKRSPALLQRVEWLERPPDHPWDGVVVANELLDAMPVSRFRRSETGWQESCIGLEGDRLEEHWRQASSHLSERLQALQARLGPFPVGYISEINLRLDPWFRTLAGFLRRGAVLLVDYGYTERGYYHPERDRGTLICHFRHRAHDDFLVLPGLQDITANVDFSAVAEAGVNAGLTLAGYTSQSQFLMGCGLDGLLAESDPGDVEHHLHQVQAAKQLLLPSAMGERFQAIGFVRGIPELLRGFALGDRRDSL